MKQNNLAVGIKKKDLEKKSVYILPKGRDTNLAIIFCEGEWLINRCGNQALVIEPVFCPTA